MHMNVNMDILDAIALQTTYTPCWVCQYGLVHLPVSYVSQIMVDHDLQLVSARMAAADAVYNMDHHDVLFDYTQPRLVIRPDGCNWRRHSLAYSFWKRL